MSSEVEEAVQAGVDRLESEIERAVGLIDRLRKENRELKQRVSGLESQAGQKDHEILDVRAERDSLRSERDNLKRIYDENASLIERKGEIQRKIETMLSRLDGVTADV